MRAQFVFSEIGIGLRRNLTMTVAVVVSVAISLGLFGAGLLVREQVNTMKDYWYDKVEVSIFLCHQDSDTPSCSAGGVTPAQRDAIRNELASPPLNSYVEKVFYESQEAAYANFQNDNPATAASFTAQDMPESFRVKLVHATDYPLISSAFVGKPGVEDVHDQREVLDRFFKVLNGFQTAAWFIAFMQFVAAVLLIANTIRIAAFSRRRETGIMRLVGASNFYIQLPFLLEGAFAGLIGAGLASVSLIMIKKFLVQDYLQPSFPFTSFIGWDAVWTAIPILALLGVVLPGLASFLTLRKYLRV